MVDEKEKTHINMFGGDSSADTTVVEAEIAYRPIPQNIDITSAGDRPAWRVRFDLATDQTRSIGLDINGEVILGRIVDAPNIVDLSEFGASELGVSRQHLMLKPTNAGLFVVDLGSTNGTRCNNEVIDVDSDYALVNGDTLTLGRLHLIVYIISKPVSATAVLEPQLHLEDALLQIVKSITSQLDLDEVLNQIAEMAMSLTSAGETGIWLVDEDTGDLFLEAERGIDDERVRRMRLPIHGDTLVGKVIKTGKPLRARRMPGQDQIKVKTNYLV